MRRVSVLALLVALAAGGACPTAAQARRFSACLFPTVALSEGEEAERLGDVVNRSLALNLDELGIEILPETAWRGALGGAPVEAMLNGRQAARVASRAGARMAVVSLVHLEGRQLSLGVKVVDARSGRVVSGVYATTLVGVAVHNRIAEAVDALTPQLESFINPEQRVEEVAPFVIEATLLSDLDGTRVSLGGVEPVGEISEGRLKLPFALYPVGTRMEIVEEREGYHTQRETITLDRPRSRVRLKPMWAKTRGLLYLNWTTGQSLGIGVGYRHYFQPDYFYLAAENYFYFQPAPTPDAEGLAFHDDLGVLIGRYVFSPPDSRLRFALAAGLGLILTKTGVEGVFTDWYVDCLSASLERNLRQYTIAVRADAKLTLGLGNNLLGPFYMMALQRFGPQLTLSVGRKF